MHTACEKAFFTEFALSVAECERRLNPISLLDSFDVFPDLFNDAHPFVAGPKARFPVRLIAAIKPQVGTTPRRTRRARCRCRPGRQSPLAVLGLQADGGIGERRGGRHRIGGRHRMVIGSAAVNERTAKLTPSLLQDGIQGREFCFDRGGMGLSRTPPNGE